MASSVIRRTWFGWLNPNAPAQSGARTATGTSVALTFSAAVLPASPTVSQFTATVAGVARGVTAAAIAGSVLTLTLASAVTAGQAVVITYKPGGPASGQLKDSGNDLVSGFTTPSITAT
jgi:uncharacterized repeat protein (TIGR02059 family)